ncbi:RNA polymerase sigma factor SigX [Desulfoscipio gibsoniae]|uniref:RNA polymerase sigma factor, sigma-70 family n=1 Tax=Desulfoscipio gibsoniae DSM 7213 TaxID=767817 RepID=R4KQ45_9FIRM|nr:RNA polymerase sigma factor SigX [Desulfoscipio gibsoniae]AGL01766.1 RNA polymerase sigma factor, sigma-70 family [Desulfoscipio gibsoniae DSM 7213]
MSQVFYQETYNRYYPAVCRQLTFMLGSRAVAEEITQETFLRLYCTPPRQYENIGGWLSKVAANLAYNYLRSEKSRLRREEKIKGHGFTVVSSEESALQNEESSMVRHALQSLPERDRLCLLMKHSGFSYEEIAEAIGVKKSSVGTIIARAQAKFKRVYLAQKGCDA